MTLIKPCPRCQSPLEIPQPPPEQIRCDKCGAVIKNRVSPSGKQEAPAASPPSAPLPTGETAVAHSQTAAISPATPPADASHRTAIILGMLGGLLLICVLPVAGLGLAWFFSGEKTPEEKRDPHQEQAKHEEKEKPEEPKEVPMPPRIQAAIDKGAALLKKRIQEKKTDYTGDWKRWPHEEAIGATALAGLALLEAKVHPQDAAIQEALARVRVAGPKLEMIYTLGSVLFFLNRLHDAEPLNAADRELVRSLALRVVAGQGTDGKWSYINPPITTKAEQELLQKLHANKFDPQYTPLGTSSMTQFALLALWGSHRHDIPVRPAILAAATRFHKTQYPDGSWTYVSGSPDGQYDLRDSNTCAGLIALAMEKTLREDKKFNDQTAGDPPADPKADERCDKAFARLAKVIGRTKDESPVKHGHGGNVIKADAVGDYYFLWCLERVAVIYDKKTIGGKDWYGWGSEVILQNQKEDGSWVDRHGDVADTCFAILFLTRANLAKDLTESIRMRGG